MKKTGVFYGSTTGTTESVANLIAEKLGIAQADVHDVSKMSANVAGSYEALILGTSTGDTFCDGMGILYEDLKTSGCRFIGAVSDADYTYSSSISVIDGNFVGLAIDDVNESEKTEERIASWTDMLKADLA